ncbi:phage major capsid protein [Wolbachia endosymbiont of Atemnus politus]|uniref:phage major capsid protein n=1 Tax=Wolbachia endosymbiont of Atemnus politus TaxID=2682840 RepID=UPI0015737FBA|nr:phage major capsid protein [Wolbachia endosymbiont of Atemnus politus]NSM56805.1 phage major capsid protein [Wolbachia endosymbiont of Atemnus politus]NSX83848.1 phage major capsid protein [Wolbachia endosymbiont of Atemnus politus]
MSLTDITHRVDELVSSWEQFKIINDCRLKEIESKGRADSATVEQLCKINSNIDNCKERLDLIETAVQRPEVSKDFSTSDKHFSDYIRKGVESGLSRKTLSGDDGDIGGYLVTPHIVKRINKHLTDSSPMWQICSSQRISTETLDYIIEDYKRASAGWSGETVDDESGGSKSKYDFAKDTDTPKIQKISITTYELYAQPQISQKLLDDAFVDVESWLVEKVAETFRKEESEAFIQGEGTFQPKGILAYEDGNGYNKVERVKTDKLDSDAIMVLYYSLNEYYSKNASFLMNRSTLKDVRLLKSQTGQYLWQPSLSLEAPDTLMGIPVYQSSDMPPAPNNQLPVIAVADFKQAYKIVDSRGMRILRDPYTNKPYVKFFITRRVGGEVVNTSAIKLLQVSKN